MANQTAFELAREIIVRSLTLPISYKGQFNNFTLTSLEVCTSILRAARGNISHGEPPLEPLGRLPDLEEIAHQNFRLSYQCWLPPYYVPHCHHKGDDRVSPPLPDLTPPSYLYAKLHPIPLQN
jgi:hypothetical protein